MRYLFLEMSTTTPSWIMHVDFETCANIDVAPIPGTPGTVRVTLPSTARKAEDSTCPWMALCSLSSPEDRRKIVCGGDAWYNLMPSNLDGFTWRPNSIPDPGTYSLCIWPCNAHVDSTPLATVTVRIFYPPWKGHFNFDKPNPVTVYADSNGHATVKLPKGVFITDEEATAPWIALMDGKKVCCDGNAWYWLSEDRMRGFEWSWKLIPPAGTYEMVLWRPNEDARGDRLKDCAWRESTIPVHVVVPTWHTSKRRVSVTTEAGYVGEMVDGKRDGRGIQHFAWGAVYDGEWRGDQPNGTGRLLYPEEDVYEGEMRNGALHGKGKMRYVDGSVYIGTWVDGLRDGEGVMNYADGNVYSGTMRKGKEHGKGIMVYPDATFQEGLWEEGKFVCTK